MSGSLALISVRGITRNGFNSYRLHLHINRIGTIFKLLRDF